MAEMPIVVRETWRKPAAYEVEGPANTSRSERKLRWWFGRKSIPTGKTTTIPGFGTMRHSLDGGQDKGTLVTHGSWPGVSFQVRSRTDIEKWFRRLRPQEAEKLKAAEARIAELHEQLKAARSERQAVLKEAWAKGHAVTWKELYEQAEANELERRLAPVKIERPYRPMRC